MAEDKNNIVVEEIKNLLYEDLCKTDIKEIILAWLPGISDKEFNECFTEAFVKI